jgi:hypothetical protein
MRTAGLMLVQVTDRQLRRHLCTRLWSMLLVGRIAVAEVIGVQRIAGIPCPVRTEDFRPYLQYKGQEPDR